MFLSPSSLIQIQMFTKTEVHDGKTHIFITKKAMRKQTNQDKVIVIIEFYKFDR